VGKLAFESKRARPAADGTTRIAFGWKHPKDWDQLRTVTLTARDASGAIGSVTMRPKAGTAMARGALEPAAKAALTHKGKWARATMRIPHPHLPRCRAWRRPGPRLRLLRRGPGDPPRLSARSRARAGARC